MRPTLAVGVALLLGAGAAAGQLRPGQPDRTSEWETWLSREAADFSGVAVIGRDGVIDAEMAFGTADTSTGRRNRADTRFNLGSINKTFTAIGIAQLIEQGRLALGDRLIKYLPDYPNRDAAERITIQQLLRHTSGVAQFTPAEFADVGDVSVADLTRIVAAEPLGSEPGTRQMYSNGGYVVLGRVLEAVSGRPYDEYIAEHIYRRAGMTASGSVRRGDRLEAIAFPAAADAGGRPTDFVATRQPAPRPANPAGGGYSTAADLFRFAHALRSGRLLGPAMTRYVLDGTFAEDPKWGFSLREQIVGAHRFIGNGGGAPGVNAGFRFEPAGAHIVVVLANASPPAASNLLTTILKRIADVTPPADGVPPGIGAQVTAPPTALRVEVEALHREMVAAFRTEPASVAGFYTDDARILGGGRRFAGSSEVRAYYSQVPAGALWSLEIVDVGGATAEPWVLGRSTLGRPGSPAMTVDYLAVLRRGPDGRLRYHVDMFTAGVR